MYDTLHFWIDRSNTDNQPFSVLPFLCNVVEHQAENFGYSASGTLGAFKVNVFQTGVSLKGSLAKHHFKSNLFTRTRADTEKALESLAEALHLNISSAQITRLDFSTILPTQRPPADYYPYLGNKNYYERLLLSANSLTYKTQKRQLCFYDKTKEALAKGMLIPASLINENLLRYELRLTGDIKRQLKTAAVSASMLSNANFYCKLMQLWQSEFMSINKNNINNTFNMANIKTPKEAKEALLCRLLQQENGQQIIKMFLADLKEAKVFPDVKYYSRLKTELNKLLQASTEEKNSMIKELETAIRNVAKYSR